MMPIDVLGFLTMRKYNFIGKLYALYVNYISLLSKRNYGA
jgi:hypothetical protein